MLCIFKKASPIISFHFEGSYGYSGGYGGGNYGGSYGGHGYSSGYSGAGYSGGKYSHFQQQTATKVALHIKFMTQTFLQLLIDFIFVI